MQVNMLEAKNQLSRLVKDALAGEEVIIASHGKAQVRLVPCAAEAGLRRRGALASSTPIAADELEEAFSEAVEQQVGQLMGA
jgi:prevent-host-death family protein